MCKGNCGKCKKAEFETTDNEKISFKDLSDEIEGHLKIGMTDGDDRDELQPTCMRAPIVKNG